MKRKAFAAVAAILSLLLLAGCGSPGGSDTSQEPESSEPTSATSENPLLQADFQTAEILNGAGTEKVGEYGYISYSKTDMEAITDDQLLEFCETRYDGSGLNWVWIMFDDGTGIHIGPGYSMQMEYGTTDAETCTFSALGAITKMAEDAEGNIETFDAFSYVPYEN